MEVDPPVPAAALDAPETEPGPSHSQIAADAVEAQIAPSQEVTLRGSLPTSPRRSEQSRRKGPKAPEEPVESLEESLDRRVIRIKEGDNVLVRLPSDTVKAVVASKDG